MLPNSKTCHLEKGEQKTEKNRIGESAGQGKISFAKSTRQVVCKY